MKAILVLVMFSISFANAQDNIRKFKVSRKIGTFSVIIQTGETWYYYITQDSLKIMYECAPTKSKPEKLVQKKLSKEKALNFYSQLSKLKLDTLKGRYDYLISNSCDDCGSHDRIRFSIDTATNKTIDQFNGRNPSIVILFKLTDELITKKKYKILKR